MKKPLVENLFGKIMGRLLKGQAKKVVKLLQADPELARLAKETGEASEKLKKALRIETGRQLPQLFTINLLMKSQFLEILKPARKKCQGLWKKVSRQQYFLR